MSTRYTLRLTVGGREVFKRWTGDREEALRDLVSAVSDLDIQEHRALVFVAQAKDLTPPPGQQVGVSVLAEDWKSTLSFDVRESQGMVSGTTRAG